VAGPFGGISLGQMQVLAAAQSPSNLKLIKENSSAKSETPSQRPTSHDPFVACALNLF
jgi:hypothetical protein